MAVSLLSLVVAGMMTSKTSVTIVACVWLVSSVIVVPLHFYRAWRRWRDVPNRRQYAVWVGFETLATVLLIVLFLYTLVLH